MDVGTSIDGGPYAFSGSGEGVVAEMWWSHLVADTHVVEGVARRSSSVSPEPYAGGKNDQVGG